MSKPTAGIAATAVILVVALALTYALLAARGAPIHLSQDWAPTLGLTFGILADGLSTPIAFALAFVFLCASMFSLRLYNQPRYYLLLSLYFAGVLLSILATNLIQLYIFFEAALLASWLLILLYGRDRGYEVALIYFIWTHVGSLLLLLGVFFTGMVAGSFEIASLAAIAREPAAFLIGILFLLGASVKMAAVGLHAWLPRTYVESPTPISAMIGGTSVLFGTYVMARLLVPLHEALFGISAWLELWAVATILYAALVALTIASQKLDFKALVAYLSMSQMNYCFLGIATLTHLSAEGGISYSVSHGLAISLLFLVSGALLYSAGTTEMGRLGGLVRSVPLVMVGCLTGFFTIAGIPPTIGFWSKVVLLAGAFERALQSSLIEWAVALLATLLAPLVTVAYQLLAVWHVFLGRPATNRIRPPAPEMLASILILSAVLIWLGIWPETIKRPIKVAVEALFGH